MTSEKEYLRIFSENLNFLMRKHGINQKELAERMGVSKQTVSTWCKGLNTPRTEKLDRLCSILDCDRNTLMQRSNVSELFDIRPISGVGMLPVIGLASAGKGVIVKEDIIDYEAADSRYDNGEYFYIQVAGDSMSPKINDGDLVLVHRQTSVDSGSIGVFIVDGEEGYIKRVDYDPEHIRLISLNPYYPPLVFTGPDVLRVYVVGRVVRSITRW